MMNREKQGKNGWGRIRKWIVRGMGALLALPMVILMGVRAVTYLQNHIHTENGVDEGIYVELGGQEQYLLIRGKDQSNPVMIWLHGGPAGSDAYANYGFQQYLVNEYTVVNWDQRGCGRTYYRNQKADPGNKTATFQQAQEDLDELVDYLRNRFAVDQVILVGHSYGTMLGSRYALDHPDKVSAYIGVGQVVSFESEIYSYQDALERAKAAGADTAALEKAYETYVNDGSLVNMMALRGQTSPWHTAPKQGNTIWLGIASPYMGLDDVRWFLKPIINLEEYFMLNDALFDYVVATDVTSFGMEFPMSVGFITGSCDWTTPVKYAQDYYNEISAPEKQFRLMEGCGHSPQYDDPQGFCGELKQMIQDFGI